jgi:hypothetical protein
MAQILTDISECIPGNYTNMGFTGTTQMTLFPGAVTTTGGGNYLDMSEFHVATQAILMVGAFGSNTTSGVCQIEECATTNGTYTVIPSVGGEGSNNTQMIFPTITASNQILPLTGLRTYQYVRENWTTCAGTTPSITACVLLLGMPKSGQGHTGVSNYPSGPTTY